MKDYIDFSTPADRSHQTVKSAGWFKKFMTKSGQAVKPDDFVARTTRERPVTDEIEGDDKSKVMKDLGKVVSDQQAEVEQLRAQTEALSMTADQAAMQAQQTIKQLQQQVQGLQQQAGSTQQMTAQAQQVQAQLQAQLGEATTAAMQAGAQAASAGMEAFRAKQDSTQLQQEIQAYKERIRQVLEMDPVQMRLQQQAMMMQQLQAQAMAQAQMAGQEQGQPQGQPQGQLQGQGMEVVAELADMRRATRRDGSIALKLAASDKTATIPRVGTRALRPATAKLWNYLREHPKLSIGVPVAMLAGGLTTHALVRRHLANKNLPPGTPKRNEPLITEETKRRLKETIPRGKALGTWAASAAQ